MTIDLLLPTSISLSEGINEELLKAGYFFCGVKPAADGSWKVVYCNLLSQTFDFDKLQLFAEDTKILCEYIKQEYAKKQLSLM